MLWIEVEVASIVNPKKYEPPLMNGGATLLQLNCNNCRVNLSFCSVNINELDWMLDTYLESRLCGHYYLRNDGSGWKGKNAHKSF